jgi:hypothetical protein
MRKNDQLMLEQAYVKILKEDIDLKDLPDISDEIDNIIGKDEIEVEFEGNMFFVKFDFDGAISRIITNLGDINDSDHIVEITPETAPKIYDEVSEMAREKIREEKEQREAF